MTAVITILTWTFRLIFAALLVLCGLAALAVIIGIAAAFRRASGVVEDARNDVLPGPGTPQASGAGDSDDTGISDAQFSRELRALLDRDGRRD